MHSADAKSSDATIAASGGKMSRPPVGELSIDVEGKKDVSPMAAILRSRGHLQHTSAIPGMYPPYLYMHISPRFIFNV